MKNFILANLIQQKYFQIRHLLFSGQKKDFLSVQVFPQTISTKTNFKAMLSS